VIRRSFPAFLLINGAQVQQTAELDAMACRKVVLTRQKSKNHFYVKGINTLDFKCLRAKQPSESCPPSKMAASKLLEEHIEY
jgi:hypothetical protein